MATAPNPMGYSPVPDVGPQNVPAPEFRVNVPPAAFGTNVAQAVQQLGGTIDKVGDELWDRAVAMQQIKNQADLDSSLTNFYRTTAPIHANFNSLAGRNAQDGLEKYQTDLDNAREQISDTITNPWVKTHFNNQSRTEIARDYRSGAGHAGDQLKIYQKDSIIQLMDANGHKIGVNPFDDQGFQQTVVQQRNLAKEHAALSGLNPDDAEIKAESTLWRDRAIMMAIKDPIKARKMLNDAQKAGRVRSDDFGKADKALEFQELHTGGRNISGDIFNGRNWALGNEKWPIEIAKQAIGGYESGNRYGVTTDAGKGRVALGRYQVMTNELQGQLKAALLPQMTPQEFLKNPEVQDMLFEYNFGKLMDDYGSFNEAASRWFTGRGVKDAQAHPVPDILGTNINSYLSNVNALGARLMPLSRGIAVARSEAEQRSDNPDLPDYAEHYFTQHFNQEKAVKNDAMTRDRDTLAAAMRGDYSNGNPPSSLEEFSHLPQVQEVVRNGQLPGNEINGIPARFNRFRQALTAETNQRVANKLEALADEEPTTFQAIKDFSQFGLNAKQIGHFEQKQRTERNQVAGDPELRKAYAAVRPMLPLNFDDATNKDTRLEFKGALRAAVIDRMQEKGGKRLTDEEYREVGKDLLKQQLRDDFWGKWFGSTTPWYKGVREVPKEAKQAIDLDYEEQGFGKPTEEQYIDEYARNRFRKDFGKQKE